MGSSRSFNLEPGPFRPSLQRLARFPAVEIGQALVGISRRGLVAMLGCLCVLQMPAGEIFEIVFGCHRLQPFLNDGSAKGHGPESHNPVAGCGGLGMHSQHGLTVATASAGECRYRPTHPLQTGRLALAADRGSWLTLVRKNCSAGGWYLLGRPEQRYKVGGHEQRALGRMA